MPGHKIKAVFRELYIQIGSHNHDRMNTKVHAICFEQCIETRLAHFDNIVSILINLKDSNSVTNCEIQLKFIDTGIHLRMNTIYLII